MLLVISDAVENRSSSACENETTFLKTRPRSRIPGICFLSDEDALIRENYRLNEDGNYELQAEEPETIEKLDEAMRGAIPVPHVKTKPPF